MPLFAIREIEVLMNPGNARNDHKLTEDEANEEGPASPLTAFVPTPLRKRDVFESDFLLVRDDH